MSVIVGSAGHIDHGKTSLLRALTGIDADRLPEERRRGMTIDVGYAHLALPDGDVLDFVDVPGHDRLVGNMLVGAGEIDAAMLVVAADDGPRAQTFEHLGLLDALGITDGIAVVTKADLLAGDEARLLELADRIVRLLARTRLGGSPVLLASAQTGEGLDAVRAALADLRDRVWSTPAWAAARSGPSRLAVDRSFVVRGRGRVVTGTLRGAPVSAGDQLRVVPGDAVVRVREVQVRGVTIPRAADGGRVALNLAGDEADAIVRGDVLVGRSVEEGRPIPGGAAGGTGVVATRRVLVALRSPMDPGAGGVRGVADHAAGPGRGRAPGRSDAGRDIAGAWTDAAAGLGTDGATYRLHLGTAQADATVRFSRGDASGPDGTLVTRLHLSAPLAAAAGDRFALRRPSPAAVAGGGIVLDPLPPAGPSRRHATQAAVLALLEATTVGDPAARDAALLDLHGALPAGRVPDAGATAVPAGPLALSRAVAGVLEAEAVGAVAAVHASRPNAAGMPLAELRRLVARALRRRATILPPAADAAATAVAEALVADGRLAREGDVVRDPARAAGPPPALAAAMGRLEAALTTPTPPPFPEAVRAAGCPPDGVRALEQSGRIVRLEPDLAFATPVYRDLAASAVLMAWQGPLTPAAFRDATGSSRKYALAILEDLDRRQILRRGPEGHVPGPRAPQPRPRGEMPG